jgi:hypothetical protein
MKATIADMKTLSHRLTTEEGGIHKMVYHTPLMYRPGITSRGEITRRLMMMGEDLVALTISGLKCQDGKQPSDEHADYDLWPSLGQDGEDGTLIIISVAINEEGREAMTEALENC